jgi:MoaA/NifB/PqqE/SkfB family radical SAM enzyme
MSALPGTSCHPPGQAAHVPSGLGRLPLATLYLTERCNSRCVTCDYWRNGRIDLNLEAVRRLLPGLAALRTEWVLLSGGEPLLNPEWVQIAQALRAAGLKLWLLTSGLSLGKHARTAAALFDSITVSMDGTTPATYETIRGLDAFEHVCSGIRAAVDLGASVSLRVTLQRANYRELPAFVELAAELRVRQISFLAVDVANPHAFGRTTQLELQVALGREDLPVLEQLLSSLERDHAAQFQSGFIAESPRKMRKIHAYFAAICGVGEHPPVRCNAPEFSAVINSRGRVSPCFFIPGPADAIVRDDLASVLNSEPMIALRNTIRTGGRAECSACVCSLWREPATFANQDA